MGRCLVLVGLLAVAVGALVACDGAPRPLATYKSADDGPWRVFVGDEAQAFVPHGWTDRLTQVHSQVPFRSVRHRAPKSCVSLEVRSRGPLESESAMVYLMAPCGSYEDTELRTFADDPRAELLAALSRLGFRTSPPAVVEFVAEPHVAWRIVVRWWEGVHAAWPEAFGCRIRAADAALEDAHRVYRGSNRRTMLVAKVVLPTSETGRVIEVVTDDAVAGPFPPVTIRSGGAEFRFPGGDPYATKDNVEAANRSWRALAAALRDPAAGRSRLAALAIGPRVPWAHVAQLLATLADVGITRLRMPDRPYGLELRFAALSGGDLDDLAAWDFPQASPWPWIGAGLALAALLSAGAWVWGRAGRERTSGRPGRRQASSTAQP